MFVSHRIGLREIENVRGNRIICMQHLLNVQLIIRDHSTNKYK